MDKADKSHDGQVVLCLHDYARKSRNELSVQTGDKLVLKERYHHWYLVQKFDSEPDDEDSMGLVPFNHITLVESPDKKPESADISRSRISPDEKRSSRLFGEKQGVHSPLIKSPFHPLDDLGSPSEYTSIDSSRENFKHSVQELERYIKQWESILNEREDDLNGSNHPKATIVRDCSIYLGRSL